MIPWQAVVLTIIPEMFPGPLGVSLGGRALQEGLWGMNVLDIRQFATDKHHSVDARPAGGGPGMVMRADIVARALDFAIKQNSKLARIYLSPRGVPLTQRRVRELSVGEGVILLAGRFEGVDDRLVSTRDLEELSIGDFILSGGEIPALALIDACVRLLPGVMGKVGSGIEESFEEGLLEYPQYTKPRIFEGQEIPEVLLSGDHQAVAKWRLARAEEITQNRRPDLWLSYLDSKKERED